jgi:hypothetical protein
MSDKHIGVNKMFDIDIYYAALYAGILTEWEADNSIRQLQHIAPPNTKEVEE